MCIAYRNISFTWFGGTQPAGLTKQKKHRRQNEIRMKRKTSHFWSYFSLSGYRTFLPFYMCISSFSEQMSQSRFLERSKDKCCPRAAHFCVAEKRIPRWKKWMYIYSPTTTTTTTTSLLYTTIVYYCHRKHAYLQVCVCVKWKKPVTFSFPPLLRDGGWELKKLLQTTATQMFQTAVCIIIISSPSFIIWSRKTVAF